MKEGTAKRKSGVYHPYQQTAQSSNNSANGGTAAKAESKPPFSEQTYQLLEIRAMRKIAATRKTKEKDEYLCKWQGYGTLLTWEPPTNLPPGAVDNFRKAQRVGEVDALLLIRELDNLEFTLHEKLRGNEDVDEFTIPFSISICNSEWGDCPEVNAEDVQKDKRLANMRMLMAEELHETLDNPLCFKQSNGRYRCPVFPIYFRPLVKSLGLMMHEVVTIIMHKETVSKMPTWVKDASRVFDDRHSLKPVGPMMTRIGPKDNKSKANDDKKTANLNKDPGPSQKQKEKTTTKQNNQPVYSNTTPNTKLSKLEKKRAASAARKLSLVIGIEEEEEEDEMEVDREVAQIFRNEEEEITEIDPPPSANELHQVEKVRRSGSSAPMSDLVAEKKKQKPKPTVSFAKQRQQQQQPRFPLQPMHRNFLP